MKTVIGIYDGEVVRPLEALDSEPGSRFLLIKEISPPRSAGLPKYQPEDLAACVNYQGPPKTLEQMEEDVANGIREEWSRKLGK
jgi:hypothetical protein